MALQRVAMPSELFTATCAKEERIEHVEVNISNIAVEYFPYLLEVGFLDTNYIFSCACRCGSHAWTFLCTAIGGRGF